MRIRGLSTKSIAAGLQTFRPSQQPAPIHLFPTKTLQVLSSSKPQATPFSPIQDEPIKKTSLARNLFILNLFAQAGLLAALKKKVQEKEDQEALNNATSQDEKPALMANK